MAASDRLRDIARRFEKLRKRARTWAPRGPAGGALTGLADGLVRSYRGARRAMNRAYRGGGATAFHEWRKTVKIHAHHLRLLEPVCPELVHDRIDTLDRLGDLLGQDHDLAVFARTVRHGPNCFDDPQDRPRLLTLIARRQAHLRNTLGPLGQRLFAEPPPAFRRRLRIQGPSPAEQRLPVRTNPLVTVIERATAIAAVLMPRA
jgi:hypothetical protein